MGPWALTEVLEAKRTASLLLNNLSWSCGANSLAFVERYNVHIVPGPHSTVKHHRSIQSDGASVVLQAKFVQLEADEFLVIVSTAGIQIWNGQGLTMVYFLPINECTDSTIIDDLFCRGIAAYTGSSQLYIGTSEGNVLKIHFAESDSSVESILESGCSGVTALACATTPFVSAHDDGTVAIWDPYEDSPVHLFPSDGVPCTTIGVRGDNIVAGFENGMIKVFRESERRVAYEIDAHVRPITALDVHSSMNFFVSVGEDSCVNIWGLPSAKGKLDLLHSGMVKNSVLTGVQFAQDSKNIAISSYDSSTIKVWIA